MNFSVSRNECKDCVSNFHSEDSKISQKGLSVCIEICKTAQSNGCIYCYLHVLQNK